MNPEIKKLFADYHRTLNQYASFRTTIEILIAKIRNVPSAAEGVKIFYEYKSYQFCINFVLYELDQMVATIQHNQRILDLLEIPYPSPPESIAHLFPQKQPEIKSTSDTPKELHVKLSESIEADMKLNPDKYKEKCFHCNEEYTPKSAHELYVCPLCGKSAED